MSLSAGKTLIITGASQGIGRALSLALAAEGVALVLNARRQRPLEEVVRECREAGAKVEHLAGSAASEEVAAGLVDRALGLGGFYGFVHAAGVLHPGPLLWELSAPDFHDVFEASVEAGFQISKAAFPHLVRAGEGIAVFFGSGAAERAAPGLAAYCSAKAAEEHLARQLAAEAPAVTTFVFRPGVVDTRMIRSAERAEGGAAVRLRDHFVDYRRRGELLSPDVPARALVSILKHDPGRFHGKTATWRDGV